MVALSIVALHTVELSLTVEPPCIVELPLTFELDIVEPPCTIELLQTVALSIVELSIVDC